MHKSLVLTALSTLLGGVAIVQAQLPVLDITGGNTINGQVEVRVRPDATFDGLFAALVFTIRWNDADGANLGGIQQEAPVAQYMPVGKSGSEQVFDGYRYQIFSGISLQPLTNMGASWAALEEVVICRVNIINGNSVFEVVNDGFTEMQNGDFFVSLNGQDRTGDIYTFNTSAPQGGSLTGLSIQPNPTEGLLLVGLDDPGNGPVTMELFDAAGNRVWDAVRAPDGPMLRSTLDLRGFAGGVYFLTVSTMNGRATHRVVLTQ